jgi:mannose-6-phosphate isomerase-like protein (cupin superfamily)
MLEPICLADKLALFAEPWRPKVIAALNGQEVKLVKTLGEFPWHTHADVDELFLVLRGQLVVELADQVIELGPGQLVVVPRGTRHRTRSAHEAEVLIFEPAEVRNTGDVLDPTYTAPGGVTI